MLVVKRVYEPASEEDGFRVLTDRLWPRGVSKEKAAVDVWAKEVAPSTGLRQWFHQNMGEWTEFKKKYLAELKANPDAVDRLLAQMRGKKKICLLFGSKDEEHNQAVVLRDYIAKKM